MVCSYCYSSTKLPVALVDCKVEGCALRLQHIYQGMYVDRHKIDIDRAEWKICRDSVDKIMMGGKPDKLKKVVHITVYRKYGLE